MLTSVMDLGQIPFGQPHSFNFVIKNSANAPITIKKLVVGCMSCTKATTPATIVPAGQYMSVNVVYTPGTLGPSHKRVSVLYGEDKELKLEFRADVQPNQVS